MYLHDTRDFVGQLVASVRRRARALKYRGATIVFEPDPSSEKNPAWPSEKRLDVLVSHRNAAGRVSVKVAVWPDRWVLIDVRCSVKSGWLWEFTHQGRFVAPRGAPDLVQCIEESLNVASLQAATVPSALSSIWSPRLATGPKRFVDFEQH